MILEEATYKTYGYYPKDLRPKSGKLVLTECDSCGEIRVTTKHGYRALCRSCSIKGDKHPRWVPKSKRICLQCMKEFEVLPSKIKSGGGKYCCCSCYAESLKAKTGTAAPRWEGGQVKCICKQCFKVFYVDKNEAKKGGGVYCSHPCYGKSLIGKQHSIEHIAKVAVANFKGGRRVALARNKAKRKR